MAYSNVEQKVWDLADPIVQDAGCYLYDVEYGKEGGLWILRVCADKEEGGISLDECEVISRALSEVLDREDPIDRNYYLEVSSPGVERKLKTAAHFDRYRGEMIDVGLYRALNGKKQWTGILKDFAEEVLTLEAEGENLSIPLKDTTTVHLHFDF